MPTKLKRGEFPCCAFKLVCAIWQATVVHDCGIRRPRDAVYLCPLDRRILSLLSAVYHPLPQPPLSPNCAISGYRTSVRKHWPLNHPLFWCFPSFSILLDNHTVKLDNAVLWPFRIYFTCNVKGKLINASLCVHFSLWYGVFSDQHYNKSGGLYFFQKQLNALKNIIKKQYSHTIYCSFLQLWILLHNHPRLHAVSIFPRIAGRQTGKKNDQHALLIPLRSESYTQGCGYYLSSSKSACLVIIRAWDRNLS